MWESDVCVRWCAQNAAPPRPGGDAAGVPLAPEPEGPEPRDPRSAYYAGKKARKKAGRTAVGRVEAAAAAAKVCAVLVNLAACLA